MIMMQVTGEEYCESILEEKCFYCGLAIGTFPFITWIGSGATINLHPACTLNLVVRLMHDVHDVQIHSSSHATMADGFDITEKELKAEVEKTKASKERTLAYFLSDGEVSE